MKIPDPVIIGYPARGEPRVLGEWSGHGLEGSWIPGQRITCGEAVFSVNVSYVPANPKRETLVTILQPVAPVPEEFWRKQGVGRESPPPVQTTVAKKPVQEEFPF